MSDDSLKLTDADARAAHVTAYVTAGVLAPGEAIDLADAPELGELPCPNCTRNPDSSITCLGTADPRCGQYVPMDPAGVAASAEAQRQHDEGVAAYGAAKAKFGAYASIADAMAAKGDRDCTITVHPDGSCSIPPDPLSADEPPTPIPGAALLMVTHQQLAEALGLPPELEIHNIVWNGDFKAVDLVLSGPGLPAIEPGDVLPRVKATGAVVVGKRVEVVDMKVDLGARR